MKLLATPRFLASIPAHRRAEVLAAMRAADAAYGQPHLHVGVGAQMHPTVHGMSLRAGSTAGFSAGGTSSRIPPLRNA